MFQYVIVDIDKMENITEEQFQAEFDEDFFMNYFDEIKKQVSALFELYSLNKYEGDIQEFVKFYKDSQSILHLTPRLSYRFDIGEAYTYFCIDFIDASAQMGFQTPDQALYEHLFLEYDLTPSGLQDAQSKIGVEKMYDMFKRIKEIRIPKQFIPCDLHQQYLSKSNIETSQLEKVKVIKYYNFIEH